MDQEFRQPKKLPDIYLGPPFFPFFFVIGIWKRRGLGNQNEYTKTSRGWGGREREISLLLRSIVIFFSFFGGSCVIS